MASYCTFLPKKGTQTFIKLKKGLGHDMARSVFLKALNPQFQRDYKDTLILDDEGVPTFESIVSNPYMRRYVGKKRIVDSLQKQYTPVRDTRDNYNNLLGDAYQFNTANPNRDEFVAIVEKNREGNITVSIKERTPQYEGIFNEQYSGFRLAERLDDILSPIGITVGQLTNREVNAGRIGVTNFSQVRETADGVCSLIKVANNMEGAQALPEEMSHALIGIFRDEPLVERAINMLASNEEVLMAILGADYNDVYDFHNGNMQEIAEEAAGHILQYNLLKNQEGLPSAGLFRRMINQIAKKFKNIDIEEIERAILEADASLDELSKKILAGTIKPTKERLQNSYRQVEFNALSDNIERNIGILKQIKETEAKRSQISSDSDVKSAARSRVSSISKAINSKDGLTTAQAILSYAQEATKMLSSLSAGFDEFDRHSPKQKFMFLRQVKNYINSYMPFITEVQEALDAEEGDEEATLLNEITIQDENFSIPEIIRELNEKQMKLGRQFTKHAFPAFAEFLRPFMGEEIVVPYGKYAGTKLSVESLLREAYNGDITLMDRWLDSMADSADTLLQLFAAVVNKAKTKVRLDTINDFKEIFALRNKAERQGITSFDWMFEKDDNGNKTGKYLSPVNQGQFEKDKEEFRRQLNEKYGKNARGEKAKQKLAEWYDWLDVHAEGRKKPDLANPVFYRNQEYEDIKGTPREEILKEYLILKARMDKAYPDDKTTLTKCIQIRKNKAERQWESLTSPDSIFKNIKESFKNAFIERVDDDAIFGGSRAYGLKDFDGSEYMVLPALYTNELEDPNELSDDVFGALMKYSYATNNYREMDNVVDPLEVGRTLVKENKKRVQQTRGGRKLVEKIKVGGKPIMSQIFKEESNSLARLNDFFESQIYGRYLADTGTVKIFNSEVNVNKLTNQALKISSLAQLGFNWLANLANVTTGIGMANIEAGARQFFGPKELAKADSIYLSNICQLVGELGRRDKTNKLSLFCDLFNVRQNFSTKTKNAIQKKGLLKKLVGAELAFIGQDAGDHWLYSRVAIAMAMRQKVLVNGKETNLWDALQVRGFSGDENVKELNIDDIKNLDGTDFDVHKFSRKVAHVNQSLFGIYNDEDAAAANRVALGRLALQYRKWMKAMFNRRFQGLQYNVDIEDWEEGFYRTAGRILTELATGKRSLAGLTKDLTDVEKYNLRRAMIELIQFLIVTAFAKWFEWPDDKDRPWALKMAEYSTKRLWHELGVFIPYPMTMGSELLKTVQRPFPFTSALGNLNNLVCSTLDPGDWIDEKKSGPYKGYSTLEANLAKAPIPLVSYYRQMSKFTGDIDTSINFYARNTTY